MGYKRPEDLGSHGERRVLGILTLTNIVGGIAGLAALWTLGGVFGLPGDSLSVGTVIRMLLAGAGAAAGVIATFRWTGISLWDKVLLWVAFHIRRALSQTMLKPPAALRAATTNAIAPVMRDGRVIAEVYDPNEEIDHE